MEFTKVQLNNIWNGLVCLKNKYNQKGQTKVKINKVTFSDDYGCISNIRMHFMYFHYVG